MFKCVLLPSGAKPLSYLQLLLKYHSAMQGIDLNNLAAAIRIKISILKGSIALIGKSGFPCYLSDLELEQLNLYNDLACLN